jgi:molybdopterin converting factor small subunit
MASVRVQLFADLRECVGGAAAVDVDVSAGDTVASVVDRLGIARERIKIVFLNARSASLEHVLQGGENLSLFSNVGGG